MKFDLEQRLVKFAVDVIKYSNSVQKTYAGQHLVKQLIRSATAPALNYGEAQSGESKNDFIHKIKIVLKELRETKINLTIMHDAELVPPDNNEIGSILIDEADQLIAIFVSSIRTASQNLDGTKVYK